MKKTTKQQIKDDSREDKTDEINHLRYSIAELYRETEYLKAEILELRLKL